ncbi:CAMK/CAMKL/KIN4 protein kinase [Capronia epimyces CBS 606.96]|uniref:non-specific serine/threonine protein kinase n=1 Tax=Capronia epimyces CBS 606.96 TaxID=1182542 RepID=W9Y3B9_9EURO|nr:CAMK/CAMKL/KIN4 protein kinase [Capronia epimyces CBS 606.96]EXJ87312.1 CAMK/CAMKL/KIN4 protein kinase [Capronia epimyces CBS 606.96]
MSMDTMQAPGQYHQQITTTAAYSSPNNGHYDEQQGTEPEGYYNDQPYYPTHDPSDGMGYNSQPQEPSIITSPYNVQTTTLPYHFRNQSAAHDQYDGAPIPPPRTSSQYQSSSRNPDARVVATRHARQPGSESQTGRIQNRVGDYNEELRDRPRDDTATAAASAARSRRKGPSSPDGPHRAVSTRERSQHTSPSQSRSEATMLPSPAPPPLVREYSEVINRLVVSDPQVDVERLQERVAEAQPAPIGLDAANADEASDEALPAPGPARRQDYSKARRKEVQFGDYMLGQTLGEGEFGKVKLGWKKDGSTQVAIKLIRRETVASNPTRLPKIYREISILRDLAHPNIVRLHEMVETERYIGIILEYASGGELFDYILNHRYLKDPAARRLFAQLVSGVGYLHKNGIVHRDLKLENLLLDQNRNIIITDFGFANTFDPKDELSDEIEYNLGNREFVRKFKLDRLDARGMRRGDLMQTSCGSPCYAAPELVVSDSLYTGRKVDVWSCGVILYAMLAGYLPFDDDPANPEGDNINLLYKYITTTPLTFPEYVTPHARDLLRRILVPDPRKRADLFEVARHSWLSEFHHLVLHITSSTTNVTDIAQTTVPTAEDEPPALNRSASVREGPSRTGGTSPGALSRTHEGLLQDIDESSTGSRRDRAARHTLQPEYVPPQTHTARVQGSVAGAPAVSRTRAEEAPEVAFTQPSSLSKPLPQDPPVEGAQKRRQVSAQEKLSPPVRPSRDIPRSVSDSPNAFGASPNVTQGGQYMRRPSTQGSMTSASGPANTRSDLRLPSRGSYGQPVAPTVAATNVQGRVTQPTKPVRGYNISGPLPQTGAQNSIGQPMTTPMPNPSSQVPQKPAHHRRSSTLSGLGERLFGRSNSVVKKETERQKNGRKYPPTSMREYPSEAPRRMSTDSKRSFSFGLGKKRSTDLESQGQTEKTVRRFSLIPNSLSFKGLMGGSKDEPTTKPGTPHGDMYVPPTSSRPPTGQEYVGQQISNTDGQQDGSRPVVYNNFSRPPQPQYQAQRGVAIQSSNDVYGGTGVYSPPGQDRTHHRQQSEPMSHIMAQYPDMVEPAGRPSMQQGRQGRVVLVKNNRRFADAYDRDQGPTHHGGRSGAVKKVQDFFRRRRAPAEG